MSAVTWKQQAAKARDVIEMHLKWGYMPLEVTLYDTHFTVKKLVDETDYSDAAKADVVRIFDENLEKAVKMESYCYTTPIRINLEWDTLGMFNELDHCCCLIKK